MGAYNQGGGGNGQGPRPRGPQPPNLEDLIRRGQDQFRRFLPGRFGGGGGILLIVAALLLLWLVSGFFIVRPDEQGIVLRFGAYNRMTQPGWSWHAPAPIESVLKPK